MYQLKIEEIVRISRALQYRGTPNDDEEAVLLVAQLDNIRRLESGMETDYTPSPPPTNITFLTPAIPLIRPRLLWAVKTCILQFSSSSGTSWYSSYKLDHPILLDTHPTLPHLLHSTPGSCAAPAFPRILRTALPAPSPPVSRQSGLGYYAFLVSPLFLD